MNMALVNHALQWLDARTGLVGLTRDGVNPWLPGGARWASSIGALLLFNFVLLLLTGVLLSFSYSPSTLSAWESVYFIQHQLTLGWLIRGIHHFASHAILGVLGIHFATILLTRFYQSPRELSFWVWLALAKVIVLLFLSGFILPWDQYGYHGSVARNKILGTTPVTGQPTLMIVQGGSSLGHLSLTRFYAIHALVLPAIAVVLFGVYGYLVWRQRWVGLPTDNREPASLIGQPATVAYWPTQAARDAVLWLGLIGVVVGATLWLGAPLWGPANSVDQFGAARPEPEFFFLFRFLKLEIIQKYGTPLGAVYIPGMIATVIVLMPLIARWKWGHYLNIAFVLFIGAGASALAWTAVVEDERDLEYQAAFAEAEREGERAVELASHFGVPATGALDLAQSDPLFMGPKLFARNCASCHRYDGHNGLGAPVLHVTLDANHVKQFTEELATAADLGQIGSRGWITAVLTDFERVFEPLKRATFDGRSGQRMLDGEMAAWSRENAPALKDPANAQDLAALVEFMAQQAGRSEVAIDTALADRGATIFTSGQLTNGALTTSCGDCHAMTRPGTQTALSTGAGDGYPDLSGYASRKWLEDFIANPAYPRFYGPENNLMPAFAGKLSAAEISLITRWMVKDYYMPTVSRQSAAIPTSPATTTAPEASAASN